MDISDKPQQMMNIVEKFKAEGVRVSWSPTYDEVNNIDMTPYQFRWGG